MCHGALYSGEEGGSDDADAGNDRKCKSVWQACKVTVENYRDGKWKNMQWIKNIDFSVQA